MCFVGWVGVLFLNGFVLVGGWVCCFRMGLFWWMGGYIVSEWVCFGWVGGCIVSEWLCFVSVLSVEGVECGSEEEEI